MNDVAAIEQTVDHEKRDELSLRIKNLCTFEDIGSLKTEMDELQKALLANPAACALLIDEDIGLAVQALTRLMQKDQVEAAIPKPKGRKAGAGVKQLSALELKELMNSISDDDL